MNRGTANQLGDSNSGREAGTVVPKDIGRKGKASSQAARGEAIRRPYSAASAGLQEPPGERGHRIQPPRAAICRVI